MDVAAVLFLGLLQLAANCSYDGRHDLANKHADVCRLLGLRDETCSHRMLACRVPLLTPELLVQVNLRSGSGPRVGRRASHRKRAAIRSHSQPTCMTRPT